jgi:PilZ domain
MNPIPDHTELMAKAVRRRARAARLIPLRVDTSGGSVAKMSEPNGGSMDNAVERRAARRFSMMLPLKVRFSKDDDLIEKHGETRDVSFRGLYFTTEGSLELGASIEFVLTLPQQITLAGDVHIRCYARVLRVDPQNGNRGVAARIDRYEFLPAAS